MAPAKAQRRNVMTSGCRRVITLRRYALRLCGRKPHHLSLLTFDGEINRLCDAAANTEYIVSKCKITEFDPIVLGGRDYVSISIQQLEIDALVSVVLIYLRIEPVTSKRKRNLN